jgi:hypothetical protein
VCVRYQEDGVQDAPVAREVLLLRRLQHSHRHQVVHPQGAGDLLRWVLRGEVRHSLHQMQQGRCRPKNISLFMCRQQHLACLQRRRPTHSVTLLEFSTL